MCVSFIAFLFRFLLFAFPFLLLFYASCFSLVLCFSFSLLCFAQPCFALLCIHVGQLFRWAPGTRSALTGRRLAVSFPAGRDAVKARDALLGQCPLGQPRGVRRRGYSPTDTAHEMRIPLRPLRMSKPYRRLRKRSLRSD